jgi:ATP adenylyltransferase
MERLWSPWRLAYVTGKTGDSSRCIFCDAADPAPDPSGPGENEDNDSLVLVRGRVSYVILNLYPYNNGHLMVVPNRHVGSLAEAMPDELAEMMAFTRDAEVALAEAYQPQGLNVGINLGRAAGAGIIDHIHIHLVPRWTGDTNFMSVVGGTRVLPEDMQETVKRLRPIFERLLEARRSTQRPLST